MIFTLQCIAIAVIAVLLVTGGYILAPLIRDIKRMIKSSGISKKDFWS